MIKDDLKRCMKIIDEECSAHNRCGRCVFGKRVLKKSAICDKVIELIRKREADD